MLSRTNPERRPPSRFAWLTSLFWGLILAGFVSRHFFSLDAGEFFNNHDAEGYGLRVIEFRDCLANGYVFPEWCTHFRSGLGSPYFHYYQPGFFYAASLTPSSWPIALQVGVPLFASLLAGYSGMLVLLGTRLGLAAGVIGGSLLLASPYVFTNLYLRGDFSEAAAMMFVPGVLHALLRQFEEPTRRVTVFGALMAMLLPVTHCAVGLVSYGFFACLVVGIAIMTRQYSGLVRATLMLGFGVGLAAFYWLPVFLDSSLVRANAAWAGQAFDGYYHYSRHFVPLQRFFDREITPTPIPVKLGLIPTLLGIAGVIVVALRRKALSFEQRLLTWMAGSLFVGSLFLITPRSAFVWDHLPLLERIQFPWRLLSLVSIALAALGSLTVGFIPSNKGQVVCCVVLLPLLLGTLAFQPAPQTMEIREPTCAMELADRFFAPDLVDEWLPQGAEIARLSPKERIPRGNAGILVRSYQMFQGRLVCKLESSAASTLVLPHYYFPMGWSATFNEEAIPLDHNSAGLMQVSIPANSQGTLEMVWSTTRTKRIAVGLSLATFLIGAACFAMSRRQLPYR